SDARPADNSATQPVDVSAGSAVLPNTGSNVESNLELAAAMVATGAFGLLLVRRRRRTTT
ncbi:MAG: LPXTG cell wall anchor domain-containing protein, partial [Ilumatobacteraceae bacterium]|nr:LPXTG cell wall anchor domain-containing protein [Ilumatobacteraceae bacterium]